MLINCSNLIFDGTDNFRRYISFQIHEIRRSIETYKRLPSLIGNHYEEYFSMLMVVELDDEFHSLLTPEEDVSINYFHYHHLYDGKPKNYEENLKTAEEKWRSIFIVRRKKEYGINPKKFGLIIKTFRETNKIKKTELASRIGIDRNTLSSYENGKMLPSLLCAYKISKIFDISLDRMIELASYSF